MRAVINVSTKKYWQGQERLVNSLLESNRGIAALLCVDEVEVNAPLHTESMYAFKPYSFARAAEQRYTTLLWLDASMYVLKDLTPIFDQIERDGYFFQDSGWTNERWTPPHVKDYFGTNEGKMISSGVLGLDLNNPIGREFLIKWKQASDDGMFNGDYETSRHDQTCASLIIQNMGLTITPNNTFWTYGEIDTVYPDNILIIANGIC